MRLTARRRKVRLDAENVVFQEPNDGLAFGLERGEHQNRLVSGSACFRQLRRATGKRTRLWRKVLAMRNHLNAHLFRRSAFILSFILLLFAPSFGGVETVVIEKVQLTKTLGGVVTDASDAPLANVQVVEVTSDWQTTIRGTMTDTEGRWSLPSVPKQQIYVLRFITKQCCFNELICRVKLNKRKGKELRIRLELST
jgi:hypothetical protein